MNQSQICVHTMSEDTSVSAKDNIDRSQVFAVYNVYRLVIGSVLFALTLSSTESALVADEIPVQMLVAGILIVSSLIIATLGPRSKLTSESGIFGVMMIDVVATTLIADPSTVVASGFTALYLVTVAAASMLLQSRQLALPCAFAGAQLLAFPVGIGPVTVSHRTGSPGRERPGIRQHR